MPNMQAVPVGVSSANDRPMIQQVQAPLLQKQDNSGLIKTIAIIVLSLIAVTFVGLFVWMMLQYNEARSDVDGQIAVAVAEAKDEQAAALEEEFQEREKNPYKTFSGPADYGQLTFDYPKTWSVYVAADTKNGGNFEAYFNPNQVEPIAKDTVNALRVSVLNENFDKVAEHYQKYVDRKDSTLTMQAVTVNGIAANRYSGGIPDTDLSGFIVIFKIRDKTAVLRTDSVLFQEDFDTLLNTITFND